MKGWSFVSREVWVNAGVIKNCRSDAFRRFILSFVAPLLFSGFADAASHQRIGKNPIIAIWLVQRCAATTTFLTSTSVIRVSD
jgi:hypothetical protein